MGQKMEMWCKMDKWKKYTIIDTRRKKMQREELGPSKPTKSPVLILPRIPEWQGKD